jgi:hypothetical protein
VIVPNEKLWYKKSVPTLVSEKDLKQMDNVVEAQPVFDESSGVLPGMPVDEKTEFYEWSYPQMPQEGQQQPGQY